MCLVALFYRVLPDSPVVVGANREEAYSRQGTLPQIFQGPCRAIAGVDPQAGGTWLGINQHGVVVAVTNRLKSALPNLPVSRGWLARELLKLPSAEAATAYATEQLDSHRYAGCNVLCVDRNFATIIHAGDWLRVHPLPPGLHVLTARDVNDENDRRIAYAIQWLSERRPAGADDCMAALRNLCAQTGNSDPPICLRGPVGGTISSTIIAARTPLAHSSYWHAQGPPHCTPYHDYSYLYRELTAPSDS